METLIGCLNEKARGIFTHAIGLEAAKEETIEV